MATPPTVDSRSQFTIVLTQAPEVEGGQVMVTPEAFVGPGVTPAAVEQAQATADAAASAAALAQGDATQALSDAAAAQQDATQALADSAVVWVPVVFSHNAGGISPVSATVPAPVTGTVDSIMASATGQPNGTITLTLTIGGTPVVGGAVSILTTDAAGTIKSSTATADNAVVSGTTSVLVTATTASTSNLRITLMIGFRRA